MCRYEGKPGPANRMASAKPIMSLDEKAQLCTKYDLTYAQMQQIVLRCSSKKEIKEKCKEAAANRKPWDPYRVGI